MSHSVKRTKSRNEQFRMVVPKDIRDVVGVTEWTATLDTNDPLLAAERRGLLVAEHKAKIRLIRERQDRSEVNRALAFLDGAFERLAETRGSMDHAVAQQLMLLASTVIDSWQENQTVGQLQSWGDVLVSEPVGDYEPIPSLDTDEERSVFRLRSDLFEGRRICDGIVYRELAALLLKRRVFRPVWFAVSYMTSIEPRLRLDRNDVYDAVAESYLRRLSQHEFINWPNNIHSAIGEFPAKQNSRDAVATTTMALEQQSTSIPAGKSEGLWSLPLWIGVQKGPP